MLHAVLLKLRSSKPVFSSVARGHHAHAFYLRFIESAAPDLSAYLHDTQGRKPYTVAGMPAIPEGGGSSTSPGTSLWLRLTFLDDVLLGPFVERLQREAEHTGKGTPLRLGQDTLEVVSVVTDRRGNHPAGLTSFDQLLMRAGSSPEVEMDFASPTAFSLGQLPNGKRRMAILPEPELVFDSLLRKWNEYAPAPLQLDPAWRQVIAEECMLADHHIRTEWFEFPRYRQAGFAGRCRFRALSGDRDLARLLNTLTDFASYAGIGYKTTMGMGQAWRAMEQRPAPAAEPLQRAQGARR